MKDTNTKKSWQETLTDHPDYLKPVVENFLQNVLMEQFKTFIGATEYERTEERKGYRNGSYNRQLKTRVGTISLEVCRDRDGRFRTDLFERYQRSEKALVLSFIEMYVHGVSTRKVSGIIEELCGIEVSKSQVSNLAKGLDDDIKKWRSRLLILTYMYLVVDARYEKIRENGHVTSKAFVTIIGITSYGIREIIGTWVINSESFEEWNNCFSELKARGLKNVKYVTSDDNQGLVGAIKKNFQGALWQRCQVHFTRNLMGKLASSIKAEGIKLLQNIFAAESREEAITRKKPLTDFLHSHKKEAVAEWIETDLEDALAVYDLPKEHWKQMRTTNMVERLNEELKRRSRVVRIFPNEASCLRLLTAICMEISEGWANRRYLKESDKE